LPDAAGSLAATTSREVHLFPPPVDPQLSVIETTEWDICPVEVAPGNFHQTIDIEKFCLRGLPLFGAAPFRFTRGNRLLSVQFASMGEGGLRVRINGERPLFHSERQSGVTVLAGDCELFPGDELYLFAARVGLHPDRPAQCYGLKLVVCPLGRHN
jgi:hypothetical protein